MDKTTNFMKPPRKTNRKWCLTGGFLGIDGRKSTEINYRSVADEAGRCQRRLQDIPEIPKTPVINTPYLRRAVVAHLRKMYTGYNMKTKAKEIWPDDKEHNKRSRAPPTTIPRCSMVLEFLPTFTPKMSQFCGSILQHHASHLNN